MNQDSPDRGGSFFPLSHVLAQVSKNQSVSSYPLADHESAARCVIFSSNSTFAEPIRLLHSMCSQLTGPVGPEIPVKRKRGLTGAREKGLDWFGIGVKPYPRRCKPGTGAAAMYALAKTVNTQVLGKAKTGGSIA